MDLATQIISNNKRVRNDTMVDLKEFNNQPLATQGMKGELLVFLMPAIKEAFSLLGDNFIEVSTQNDASKEKIGSYNEKCFEESKGKLL